MSTFIPYVVLAVVVLGFFGVCYAVFNKSESNSDAHSVISKPPKKSRPGRLYEQEKVHITPRETHDGVDVTQRLMLMTEHLLVRVLFNYITCRTT